MSVNHSDRHRRRAALAAPYPRHAVRSSMRCLRLCLERFRSVFVVLPPPHSQANARVPLAISLPENEVTNRTGGRLSSGGFRHLQSEASNHESASRAVARLRGWLMFSLASLFDFIRKR